MISFYTWDIIAKRIKISGKKYVNISPKAPEAYLVKPKCHAFYKIKPLILPKNPKSFVFALIRIELPKTEARTKTLSK